MESLLIKSVTDGRIRQTSLLLKAGANVDQRDKNGKTGLIRSMFHKNPNVQIKLVKLLLQYGAKLSLVDDQGRNAFLWACYHGCEMAIKYFISKCDVNSLKLDGQDKYGYSSIHLAIKNGHIKVIEELMKQLKNLGMQYVFTLKDNKGISPLTEAFQQGKFDIAKYLIIEGKLSVDELTNQLLHSKIIMLNWTADDEMNNRDVIITIIKNCSEEQDLMPSAILKLLITNESYREVALKSYKEKLECSTKKFLTTTNSSANAYSRKATTAPGRLRITPLNTDCRLNSKHKSLQKTTSIKGMLPKMMDMYQEQHSVNYRPSSQNEFVPYSVLNHKLRTITPKDNYKISRNTLSALPGLNRLTKPEPNFMRMNRSTSVQLPQLNSWSLLRKKLRGTFIQEL